MKSYRKAIVIIVVVICLVAVCFGCLWIYQQQNRDIAHKDENTSNTEKEIEEVQNYDKFFTVVSCINRYLEYVQQQDKESLYKLLDRQYIEQNHINETNVLEYVEDFQQMKIFKADRMFLETKDSIEKYYIYGTIQDDLIDEEGTPEDYNIVINLDTIHKTYSVIPHGKLTEDKTYLLK